MSVFAIAIFFFFIYRLITGFIIPLFRSTRVMRQQFHNMTGQPGGTHAEPKGQTNGPSAARPTTASGPDAPAQQKSSSSGIGEYIDFEEVR